MKICAIMDIDNVYADSRKWEEKVPKNNTREAWDEWHNHRNLSKPNPPMIQLAKDLQKLIPVFFVTSREDRGCMRDFSIFQIETYSNGAIKIGDRNKLFMRKENDFRPSEAVKQEILKNDILGKGFKPIIAVDDNKANADMFIKNGVPTKLYTIA